MLLFFLLGAAGLQDPAPADPERTPLPSTTERVEGGRKRPQQEDPLPPPDWEPPRKKSGLDRALDRLRIEVDYWMTASRGKIHATEIQSEEGGGQVLEGTRLDLGDDFDIDEGAAGIYRIGFAFSRTDRLSAHVLYEESGWNSTLPRDILFNETFYDAEIEMHSELHHFHLEMAYERSILILFPESVPTELALRAGSSWDRVGLKLDGDGKRKGEDFDDEIIPTLGISLRSRLSTIFSVALDLDRGFDVFELTYHSEETEWTRFSAGLEVTPSPNVSLRIGYRIESLHSEHEGPENDKTHNRNDNEFDLDQEGWFFSLTIRL